MIETLVSPLLSTSKKVLNKFYSIGKLILIYYLKKIFALFKNITCLIMQQSPSNVSVNAVNNYKLESTNCLFITSKLIQN